MTEVDLTDLIDELDQTAKDEFASGPEVVDKGHDLHVDDLPIKARKWHKVTDAVAVVADLKNSARLGTGKHAKSTASIYQASTGGVVRIFDEFEADFLAIQGDGAFALFWGDKRYERALCAGVTVKTFSLDLVKRLEERWPNDTELPTTGFKVGVAASRLLVKRVGTPRNPNQQEPVWAGKAVNYAAKAAQGVDRHVMAVTGSVWDQAQRYEYLTYSRPAATDPARPSGPTTPSNGSRTAIWKRRAGRCPRNGATSTARSSARPSCAGRRSAMTLTRRRLWNQPRRSGAPCR